MPKQVDHAQRRQEIVDALWRVTARDGLAAVSFREVAAEAGVSVRRVQYYFGTKAQLLLASLQLLGERIVGRGMVGIRAAGPDPAPMAVIRAAVEGAQPLDAERRRDVLLFFCFYIASLTDAALAAEVVERQKWMVPMFADLIRQAVERGEAWDGIDPDYEAAVLLAANTGLALSALAGLSTPEESMAAMDYQLARIFRPRPKRRR
ncbi:MAG: TetR family transcriptional regulator C-terminal domain-containing protein [Actinobacteria bacterium]|nr:TetR family transcriptional regulator C-terminal domain-containing protein [Actinomycetota bacterium]MBV9255080.1 TetR family transcriptional regulator C-terminal domain-containing protein [Actinomycetota bacterium]MBV9663546.1 TetR family transcriptional regulator C-terminal domain-containing protein [Actinomycetota bacterium]MBV9936316.1 TetR family transcriptional regulator C-terminal domain-containing protein [Actinomycetota bacterium]